MISSFGPIHLAFYLTFFALLSTHIYKLKVSILFKLALVKEHPS